MCIRDRLSSDYLATVSPLKLTIDDSRQLSFNQDAYITALRSQTASKDVYKRQVQYNRQTKADAYYWCGESYYRLSRMVEAARDFNAYLQLTTQPNNEM